MRKELLQTIEAYNDSATEYENTIAKLANYNETYDFLVELINKDGLVLDLGCGPANISKYLKIKKQEIRITGIDLSVKMIEIAKKNIKDGCFIESDVLTYKSDVKYNAIIIGFAFPYLSISEISRLMENTSDNLVNGGLLYLSFMEGEREGYERPSFKQSVKFYIYYHKTSVIIDMLKNNKYSVMKTWQLDYSESDGSVTKDIVIIAKKI